MAKDNGKSDVPVETNTGSKFDLVKAGCFGPFSNGPINIGGRKLPNSFGPVENTDGEPNPDIDLIIDESLTKKRRYFPPSQIDLNNNPDGSLFSDVAHTVEIDTMELNCHSPPIDMGDKIHGGSERNEIDLIVEIGKLVDVDIEVGNEILEEVMGVDGEIHLPQ